MRESTLDTVEKETSSSVGAETEDSEEKLERSATVLVALRNDAAVNTGEDDEEEENAAGQCLERLPDVVVGQDPECCATENDW